MAACLKVTVLRSDCTISRSSSALRCESESVSTSMGQSLPNHAAPDYRHISPLLPDVSHDSDNSSLSDALPRQAHDQGIELLAFNGLLRRAV